MAWNDWGHWLTGGLGTKKGRDFLFGSGDKMKQIETLSPEQKQFFQQIMGQLGPAYGQSMGLLQGFLDPNSEQYKNFEQPYLQQFEQETIPGIAERFAGAGAQGGALSSSGFGQALSSAGSNLQTNLAQMKSMMQQQAIQQILGQSQFAMGVQPFGYQKQQGSPGFLPQFAGSFASKIFG